MPSPSPTRILVALGALTGLGAVAGCTFFLGVGHDPKKADPASQKPVTIKSFSETSAVTAIQPAGGSIWVGTSTGLQKWDIAKGTLALPPAVTTSPI